MALASVAAREDFVRDARCRPRCPTDSEALQEQCHAIETCNSLQRLELQNLSIADRLAVPFWDNQNRNHAIAGAIDREGITDAGITRRWPGRRRCD